MSQPRSIPSLDGLRTVAIGLVILSHVAGTGGSPVPVTIHRWVDWGQLGVRVFFVISGYLITRLLLGEQERTGGLSLPRFYWRRLMRIFPPLYVYLGAVACAAYLGHLSTTPRALLVASAYLTNYLGGGAAVGHTWSLSVEEQFYLLWPAAMLWIGVPRGWRLALIVVLAGPCIRVAEYWITGTTEGTNRRFEAVADALAIGCLLAYVQPWLASRQWWNSALSRGAGYLLPFIAVGGEMFGNHPLIALGGGLTVTLVAVSLLVDWTVRSPDTALGRVLNWRPMRLIGIGSYSLYLWQQPFLNRHSTDWYTAWPANLLLAGIFAVGSYFLVEQPAISVRRRLEQRRATRLKLRSVSAP